MKSNGATSRRSARASAVMELTGEVVLFVNRQVLHRYFREAIRDGIFPLDNIHDEDGALRNRGEAARRYTQDFREQCLQP